MWGWVRHLQLLLVISNEVLLGSEYRGTRDHILLSRIRDSPQPGGPVSPIYIPRNKVAQLYSQTPGSPFVASYDSQGYVGGTQTLLHTDPG
jgi:hypothetical protein